MQLKFGAINVNNAIARIPDRPLKALISANGKSDPLGEYVVLGESLRKDCFEATYKGNRGKVKVVLYGDKDMEPVITVCAGDTSSFAYDLNDNDKSLLAQETRALKALLMERTNPE